MQCDAILCAVRLFVVLLVASLALAAPAAGAPAAGKRPQKTRTCKAVTRHAPTPKPRSRKAVAPRPSRHTAARLPVRSRCRRPARPKPKPKAPAKAPARPPAAAAGPSAVTSVSETKDAVSVRRGGVEVRIARSPWRLEVLADGRPVVAEAPPTAPDPIRNADRTPYDDVVDGIDLAYPGLDEVSYRPFAHRRDGRWLHLATARGARATGPRTARVDAVATDGRPASVDVRIDDDGAVGLDLELDRGGPAVTAVAEAFATRPGDRYVGGGQRFTAVDQTGRSVPLWISHGQGSDRFASTNEIAAPFLLSTGGWGLWSHGDARGELNVAVPSERPDALSVVREDDRLSLTLFLGRPADVLASYTFRAGRPPAMPDFSWRPMVWQDEDNTQDRLLAMTDRLRARDIPTGSVWIDNPWESGRGAFAPDPKRFADFDGFVRTLHGRGVKVVTWASPYAPPDAPGVVGGTPANGNDATYLPPRGLDPHLDLSDPAVAERFTQRATALLRRGVDGFKLDRGEEDLGDGARFADGRPNRLAHNGYVVRYQAALREACRRASRDADCFLIARGGWTQTPALAANWAGDNLSAPGPAGLGQALNSLLSLSLSGQPISGSDIGGYVGTRQDTGEGFPTKATFLRWAQLGALSPIMQTPIDPTVGFDAETVRIFRRYARLHDRLAPYTARRAAEARERGMPIVRPMLLAYPDDPAARGLDDQYLYGPDLLVAPITTPSELGADARQVYLPAGRWIDAWTRTEHTGPIVLPVVAPLDRLPLYLRAGGELTSDLTAGL